MRGGGGEKVFFHRYSFIGDVGSVVHLPSRWYQHIGAFEYRQTDKPTDTSSLQVDTISSLAPLTFQHFVQLVN